MRCRCGIVCVVLSLLMMGCGQRDADKPGTDQGDVQPAAADSPTPPTPKSQAAAGARREEETAAADPDVPGEETKHEEALDAEQVLASALSQAGSEGKRVLVHLGAPW